MPDLSKSLAIAVKTGKVLFGASSASKGTMAGKVRLVVVASNCPMELRENLRYYCRLSKIPFITFTGTSLELGKVCGKPFVVSVLTIRDPGDSDVLSIAVKDNV